ncbi:DKNYY domain-containing protein [Methylocella sp. CPCC 101449]|uniref:DKNYY domain-containing protein n=1 Tax=Methylocella sp. CPCC 101449 TaxID=2987531 RepID=UPI00288C642A|nr:DKNYY domain-containing protein [Methylocella sp. CPCC 101449]MDT2020319.1 DKNYY domain-containing protein [Methylocella sp. CPCC 101449]
MSEPSSFTALIHMSADAYSRLMRGKTLTPLAEAIAGIVVDRSKDIVVFTYLKKEQALFAHVYFYYPLDLDAIIAHPGVAAILRVADVKDTDIADRAVISHDANNFTQSEPSAGFRLERGSFHRDDAFDAGDIAAFDKRIDKQFFKFAEDLDPGSAQWLDNRRIIDTGLRRKVERSLDVRRAEIAKERVPQATPLEPVRLCNGYHYNGHFMLATDGGLRPLPQLDPMSFRQTNYGGADADHVVFGKQVLRTDPSHFKMLSKSETHFYVGADNVFDGEGNAIAGADPKTFKLVHYAFARDKTRWYTFKGQPLDDVGDKARVDETLFYSKDCLLIGTGAIYLGAVKLPLDAPSCRLAKAQRLREDPCYGGLLWFADDEGDCIVSMRSRYGETEPDLTIKRTTSAEQTPETIWTEETARWESFVAAAVTALDRLRQKNREDINDDEARRAFIAFFEAWCADHFEATWSDNPFNGVLWDGLGAYLDALTDLGMHEKVLEITAKIKSAAWSFPETYARAAHAYVALGRMDDAVAEIRRAVIYSVYGVGNLFDRPQFATLVQRPDMIQIRAYYDYLESVARYRPLTTSLGQLFLDAPQPAQTAIGQQIFKRNFYIPAASLRAQLWANDATAIAAYEQVLAAFINRCMTDEQISRIATYAARKSYPAWGDLPGLHPAAHLLAATALFEEGFFWIDMGTDKLPREEFSWAMTALPRAKAAAAEGRWAGDAFWLKISADPTYAPLLGLA